MTYLAIYILCGGTKVNSEMGHPLECIWESTNITNNQNKQYKSDYQQCFYVENLTINC